MTIEKYLEQGWLLDLRIKYLIRRMEELDASARAVSGQWALDVKVQVSRDSEAPYIRTLEKIEEMRERVNQEFELLMDLKEQIDGVIKQLEDAKDQIVIQYKYLEHMTLEGIAETMNVSRETVKKWHREALAKMKMPETPIVIGAGV